MTAALDPPSSAPASPAQSAATPGLTQDSTGANAGPRGPLAGFANVSPGRQTTTPRLRITAAHAAALPRYVPWLVAAARVMLSHPDARGAAAGSTAELVVDLGEVPAMPCCAELVFLVDLLRRALGPTVGITLVGVTPAVAAPLISGGLGEGVVVVDARGRRWPGQSDRVRPSGTWP